MQKEDYTEIKSSVIRIIGQMKIKNLEKGEYLERHFIFNDKDQTLLYSGVGSALDDLLKNTEILEISPYLPELFTA